jgi:hypothetical protein
VVIGILFQVVFSTTNAPNVKRVEVKQRGAVEVMRLFVFLVQTYQGRGSGFFLLEKAQDALNAQICRSIFVDVTFFLSTVPKGAWVLVG